MVIYKKIYLEVYKNKEYMCLKNNIAHLYFILRRAHLPLNFFSLLRDAPDIHQFPTMGSDPLPVGQSVNIKAIFRYTGKKFNVGQLPYIKYNCAVLFLRQMYWLFMCSSKYIFS